jgi:outer membrane biosynthesis protein TonB
MTTAEIMFAQPGDGTIDRKQEARKVLWALLAALFIHLVVAYTLAALGGAFSPMLPVEEKPVELTLVDLPSAPLVRKNAAFMETDESKQSAEPPKEKTFESNANSIAASELPATGEAPLPSQQGKDRPFVDLETHAYTPEIPGAVPQPRSSAVPQEKAKPLETPQQTPQPAPMTATEQFAMLTARPTPAVQPSVKSTSAQARSAYRSLRDRTRISGNITNRGISSVNALGTPLGRYEKILKDSIGSRWYAYVDQKRDLISIGTLQLRFYVDRSGRVKNLKITENTSNESFANICLQSVLESQLPPIPDDLANTLPTEGLEIEGMNFIIYPN